jgi:CdiI N-terminal domain
VFSIGFTDDDQSVPEFGRLAGVPHRFVLTVMDDYESRIAAPLHVWSEADYEAQWTEGVERLLSGAESSCLVRRMEDPASGDQTVHFWTLYRSDDESVAVHDTAYWAQSHGGPLDPGLIYEAVPPFTTSHDGLPPLESRIDTADLASWLGTAPA